MRSISFFCQCLALYRRLTAGRCLTRSLTLLGWLLVAATNVSAAPSTTERIKILYTNDIESVLDPLPAFWRSDMQRIGGIAKLATLINQERTVDQPTVLFDAGDIFTGALSKRTGGRLAIDLYGLMGYDAITLGNHEFEYGWQALLRVLPRAKYPVLNANIFFESGAPFARPYALIERGPIKIGVVGLMGIDAFMNTMMPANRKGLEIAPLESIAQDWINELRNEVDLIVLLTHQGRTAPMQTDKERDAEVQRGIDEEYALAGALRGVDVLIAGHTDHGLDTPVRHPRTGTWIVQTYGQGMHLGILELERDRASSWRLKEGRLQVVNADELIDDARVAERIANARSEHPDLLEVVGDLRDPIVRRYYRESSMGNMVADAIREAAQAEIGMITPGALRADLAAGPVTKEAVLNVFPFIDRVTTLDVPGHILQSVIEQGLRRDYGLPNYSGLTMDYRLGEVPDAELGSVKVNGEPLQANRTYRLATGSFTATGGEGYQQLPKYVDEQMTLSVADAIARYIASRSPLTDPEVSRQRVIEEPSASN